MATIRKRNDVWQVQIRRTDAPHISRSFRRRKDADAWARQMEVDADRGALLTDPRVLQQASLATLINRYRDTVSPQKKGHDVEKWLLNAFLRTPLAPRKLSSITPADFAAYRDQRLTRISPSGLNRELVLLHHVFETARIEWGYPLAQNPISLIRKPRSNPPRERRLKPGEYERLLKAADDCRNPFVKPIIVLAVETAMRRGEILAVKR